MRTTITPQKRQSCLEDQGRFDEADDHRRLTALRERDDLIFMRQDEKERLTKVRATYSKRKSRR